MDEYEEAAHDIGQGIRNLRDLIDAERERQEAGASDGAQNAQSVNAESSVPQAVVR